LDLVRRDAGAAPGADGRRWHDNRPTVEAVPGVAGKQGMANRAHQATDQQLAAAQAKASLSRVGCSAQWTLHRPNLQQAQISLDPYYTTNNTKHIGILAISIWYCI
jgi:hypothetical protein